MRNGMLSITELAAKYNVSHRTLRFYEDAGLLDPVREGNSRYYLATDEVRLLLVLKGKKFGFTLREIRELIGVVSKRNRETPPPFTDDILQRMDTCHVKKKIDELVAKRDEIENAIRELEIAFAKSN